MKNKYLILVASFLLSSGTFAYENFDCTGANPTWLLSINETNITFQVKNKDKFSMSSVAPQQAVNIPLEHLRVYRTGTTEKPFVVIIQNQSCSTVNEETVYKYEGLIVTSDKIFHGCCNKKIMHTR